ncbi:MAG: stage II sporulation protein P [Chitinophagales bacterium]
MTRKIIIVLVLTITSLVFCNLNALGSFEAERNDHGYYSLVNEKGQVIDQTALTVYEGDEYIAPDNRRYKVFKIDKDTCRCKQIGVEKTTLSGLSSENKGLMVGLIEVFAKDNPPVAIYHTHSDESYVPSDGTESANGRGGIYKVGSALVSRLSGLGVKVLYDRTTHNPHDPNAYYRSRRTASKLMRKGALALIDVHRDAVPPNVYSTTVKGEKVTKVKLVVGKQNPHMSSNLEFAKKIKAYLDKNEPGLSAGIFIGKGNYNQDLTPRSILVEVGAHTNNRVQAEKGVALFAQSIPKVLGISSGEKTPLRPTAATKGMKSDWTSILWILGLVAAAYFVYFYINKGKIKGK